MATRYINTASSAGGNGTTNGTAGSTRAYASMAEWEAARQAALSDIEEVICEGTAADTAAVIIDGWTTSASFYIDIKALAGAGRHPGLWSTSHYRLVASNDFAAALRINESYVRLTGLQFENTSADASYCVRYSPAGGTTSTTDFRMDGCILRDADGTSPANAGGFYCEDGLLTLTNTVSYGHGVAGFAFDVGDAFSLSVTISNCVAANNGGVGFRMITASGTHVIQNCYAGGNTGDDYSTNWDTRTTCYSEDGTQSTTVATYSTSTGAFFANITPGSEDFHIDPASDLVGAGTDLSGSFTNDIDGETRVAWDVGADEYINPGLSPSVGALVIASAQARLAYTINMPTEP